MKRSNAQFRRGLVHERYLAEIRMNNERAAYKATASCNFSKLNEMYAMLYPETYSGKPAWVAAMTQDAAPRRETSLRPEEMIEQTIRDTIRGTGEVDPQELAAAIFHRLQNAGPHR